MSREAFSPGQRTTGLERLNPAQVAGVLGLLPHREGGYFRETYRSPITIPTPVGSRALATSILYLITADDPSRLHRLRFDEVWFFHAGCPVEMVYLGPVESHVLSLDSPQALAPGGRWMGARVVPSQSAGGEAGQGESLGWTLVGCVVSPGFEYDDFEAGRREELLAAYPEAEEYIGALS